MEKTPFYNRLDSYEQGIYDDLINYCDCDSETAEGIMIEYVSIIKELGRVDDTLAQADRLCLARRVGHTAAQWLRQIENYRGGMDGKGE